MRAVLLISSFVTHAVAAAAASFISSKISFSLVFIVSRDQHANRMLRHEKLHFLIINISAHAFTATLAPNIEKTFPLLQFLGAKQPPLSVRSYVCCLICLSLLRAHLSYNILFCLFRLFFCFLFFTLSLSLIRAARE